MPKPQPIITSTVSDKSTSGLRSTSAFSGTAARSSARTSLSDPLAARPMGVRMASTMTASGISQLLVKITIDSSVNGTWGQLPRRRWPAALAAHGDRRGAASGGERGAGPLAVCPGGQQASHERVAGAGGVDDLDHLGER